MQVCVVALGSVLVLAGLGCNHERIEAGFWFEPVSFESPALGGPVTPEDMRVIESVAGAELTAAFKDLRITFSDRRDARYRVHVVQQLQHPSFLRPVGSAGQSRAIAGFGGWGAVSFTFVASGALAYALNNTNRHALIRAIGRGVGRTAVHEFTHQLLPTAPIHDSTDVRSYEYASAARREQYYGEMQWNLAWPLLLKRIGPSSASPTVTAVTSSH